MFPSVLSPSSTMLLPCKNAGPTPVGKGSLTAWKALAIAAKVLDPASAMDKIIRITRRNYFVSTLS